jgi:hypothetical protein
MRRKRHKQTRRGMRFYRINFGFREPYKVCVSGANLRRRPPTAGLRMRDAVTLTRSPLTHPHPTQVLLDGNFVHALRETK